MFNHLGEDFGFSQGRCVLVLGAHRSGSSVLTRSLLAACVYLGDSLYGPRFDNPKGFFEDRFANQIDDKFLKLIGKRWFSLILPDVVEPEVILSYQMDLLDNVIRRFAGVPLWGIKDPRISRLWRLWVPVFHKADVLPIFLLSSRHPYSVASSLAKRDRMPKAQALALWFFHQLDGLEAIVEQKHGLVVDYDLMIDNPGYQINRIAGFLGTSEALDHSSIRLFKQEFLDNSLRHNCNDFSETTLLEKLCLDLYEELLVFSNLPGGLLDEHINSAAQLIAKYRLEIIKFVDWIDAVDALSFSNFDYKDAGSNVDDTAHQSDISGDLKLVVSKLGNVVNERDRRIVDQSILIRDMHAQLLRAETLLNHLKDVIFTGRP